MKNIIALLTIVLLTSGCKFTRSTDIPVLQLNARGTALNVIVAITDDTKPASVHLKLSLRLTDTKEPVVVDENIVPELITTGTAGKVYVDVSGASVVLSAPTTEMSLLAGSTMVGSDIDKITGGVVDIKISDKWYSRRFIVIKEDGFSELSRDNIADINQLIAEAAGKSGTFSPLFVPMNFIRSISYAKDPFSIEPPKEIASRELLKGITHFTNTWGQCGIFPKIRSLFYKDSFRRHDEPPIYTEFTPELLSWAKLLAAANERDGMADEQVFNVVFGSHLQPAPTHPIHQGMPLPLMAIGIALDIGRNSIFPIFEPSIREMRSKQWVFVADLSEGSTLSHEIGHILLRMGHKRNPDHLMSEGTSASEMNLLTKKDCVRARANIVPKR